jgi:hypothetical protein
MGVTQLHKFLGIAQESRTLKKMVFESTETTLNKVNKDKLKLNIFIGAYVLIETGFVVFLLWKSSVCEKEWTLKHLQDSNECLNEYYTWKAIT